MEDVFIYFGIYDEFYELIGQYITVVQFDNDHVADGYTALENWQLVD